MKVEVFDEDGPSGARAERASWSARCRFRRCRSASGTIPDGAQVSRGVLRAISRASGTTATTCELTEHDGVDHLRPLRRGAQSRRRAHRHGRDLPPGRADRRGRREPGHRPAVGRRRADRAVRPAARRVLRSTPRARERIREPHPRERHAAARAGADRAGRRRFRAPRAARSSSWRCATSCTAARCKNREALANPEALEQFRDRAELQSMTASAMLRSAGACRG